MAEKEKYCLCFYAGAWYCQGIPLPKNISASQKEGMFSSFGYPERSEIREGIR